MLLLECVLVVSLFYYVAGVLGVFVLWIIDMTQMEHPPWRDNLEKSQKNRNKTTESKQT